MPAVVALIEGLLELAVPPVIAALRRGFQKADSSKRAGDGAEEVILQMLLAVRVLNGGDFGQVEPVPCVALAETGFLGEVLKGAVAPVGKPLAALLRARFDWRFEPPRQVLVTRIGSTVYD